MRTIKIFLASSEEMDYDRMVFGNLVRRLDDVYEKRGVRLKLFEWEDYDAAFNDRRKQDEYNDKVRESDVFLALFHKKAGKFTVEEFDVASEAFKEKASPKVYTYLKDLHPGEESTPELEEFKHRLFDEMGHYWCRYDSRDSLQLQFVMQLQLVESNMGDSLKVEDGVVCIDGMKVASMDRLKFAAGNEEYVKMSEELAALPPKIEKARLRLEKFPDDEDLIDDLQQKLNKYNKLKEEFADYQKILFDTAKRVARLHGERITDRMRRAIDAFNEGRAHDANVILDEAEKDADHIIDNIRLNKLLALQSLEELQLKVKTMMADATLPVDERIERTDAIYTKLETLATEADYDEVEHAKLLADYGSFLEKYARYARALEKFQAALKIRRRVLGDEHQDTAQSFSDMGRVYEDLGDYDEALEKYTDALSINEQLFGDNHLSTALSYYDIGRLFEKWGARGDFATALGYCKTALDVVKRIMGEDHPSVATILSEIGRIYYRMEDYRRALENYEEALRIEERVLGQDHLSMPASYNNIGLVYHHLNDDEKALEYCEKALDVEIRILGENHPSTASIYNGIGDIYYSLGKYEMALEYCERALRIKERVLGENHPDIPVCYNTIGDIYCSLGENEKALASYEKALTIREQIQDELHPDRIKAYEKIGDFFRSLGENEKGLVYYEKALEYWKLHGLISDTREAYYKIGAVYYDLGLLSEQKGELGKARNYWERTVSNWQHALGPNHHDVLVIKERIARFQAMALMNLGRLEEALQYYDKCLKLLSVIYDEETYDYALVVFDRARVLKQIHKEDEAREACRKSISVLNKESVCSEARAKELLDKCKLFLDVL